MKNKNKIIFKHPKSKPWTLTKDEYLFELDKHFLNLIIENITKLFYEWCNDINLNPIQVQQHLKYLQQQKKSKLDIKYITQLQFKMKIII